MRVFGGTVRIVMHMPLLHRHIALVVEDHDHDRQVVLLGRAESLNHWVIEKAPVADQQSDRPFRRGELYAERGAETLAQTTEAAEEALRLSEWQMLTQDLSVKDRLVDIDCVGGHHIGKRADQSKRLDGLSVAAGLCSLGFQTGNEIIVDACPMSTARFHRLAVNLAGAECAGQRLQRCGNFTLEIYVRMQLLINHMPFELVFVDGNDLAACRSCMRRIPRRAAANQKNKIGVLEVLILVGTKVKRVVGRKIGKVGNASVNHGYRKQISKRDERCKCRRIAA